ncbi:uncharacterized protein BKCO1_1400066 [Diplodia corticola]|uniref:Uncharacterized protein n=1 Tax=Diplodia corticola TaxID=236234 RepID=A0A1J9R3L6_9PEZI|nr:uncharacterized protein BKCO1_1400066 [Diplodia corticola]OJD36030.1 hypothetical protein BKCO1_1400066 [Diplodia corticola]
MSSNLMDTEPGGRNTQYESIKTVTNPTAKEPGQLGHAAPPTNKTADDAGTGGGSNTHVSPAEKIRFGQAMSEEGGVSGYTEPAAAGAGRAVHEGGFGGTEALVEGGDGDAADEARRRRAQGYGGSGDMDKGVGA